MDLTHHSQKLICGEEFSAFDVFIHLAEHTPENGVSMRGMSLRDQNKFEPQLGFSLRVSHHNECSIGKDHRSIIVMSSRHGVSTTRYSVASLISKFGFSFCFFSVCFSHPEGEEVRFTTLNAAKFQVRSRARNGLFFLGEICGDFGETVAGWGGFKAKSSYEMGVQRRFSGFVTGRSPCEEIIREKSDSLKYLSLPHFAFFVSQKSVTHRQCLMCFRNRFHLFRIAIICPSTGVVAGWLDLSSITRLQSGDVLNGIAFDHRDRRLFITGKLWRYVFELEVPDLTLLHC